CARRVERYGLDSW
nr:immunoglobulin heavy chain junction region [Macaca mulatta]MOV86692.1 immunoglobulin heavy chain junction region [Macaca mulatta]MOV86960.1 immunoglobulin heavy chain junction region [Macaca mulatta]MOV87352.1 immunoglobulin heavy chain junction region [Macaca mulatta]MOV87597.1 immunoglobulin heavy chain junction region [Macaca mulatta]